MSGLIVRVGAVVIVAAALGWAAPASATAVAAPVVPVEDTASSVDLATLAPLTAPPAGDPLPAPLANQTGTTAIPVPPGVVFGLVGLASAAIARRRYLKRH